QPPKRRRAQRHPDRGTGNRDGTAHTESNHVVYPVFPVYPVSPVHRTYRDGESGDREDWEDRGDREDSSCESSSRNSEVRYLPRRRGGCRSPSSSRRPAGEATPSSPWSLPLAGKATPTPPIR